MGPRAGLDGWGKLAPPPSYELYNEILKATCCRTQNIGCDLYLALYGGDYIPLIDTGF